MNEQPTDSGEVVNTGGGPYVKGSVNTSGGDFVGRDKTTNIFNYLFDRTPESAALLRARKLLLENVYKFWVEGVFKRSLHNEALIALGLEERPNAVENRPWDMVLQTPHQLDRLLPSGTKIIDVFDQQQQSLLILGAPGSGKTTILLELARDLIKHAEKDMAQLIPVVLNLSSWVVHRQPIAEWLVAELNNKYYIAPKVAQIWVENDALLLLLDGLDEVKLDDRSECIKAINTFLKTHIVALAVCSRIADYEILDQQLQMQGAVLIQPLQRDQVEDYFVQLGADYATVRTILRHDAALQELAESPLMLSVITLAYQGIAVEEVGAQAPKRGHRQHLFDTYIQRMLSRREPVRHYSPQQAIQWLAWLAKNMKHHQQTIFLIERLQSSALQVRTQVWMYILASSLIFGLVSALSGGLIFGLGYGIIYGGLQSGLIVGLIVGLIYGLIGCLVIVLGSERGYIKLGEQFAPSSTKDKETLYGNRLGLNTGTELDFVLGCSYLIGLLFFLFISGLMTLGVEARIKYAILRSLLFLYNYAPLNYARFLDYCTDRIFLRKVGGGYIFVHRLLMEHFVSLTEDDIKRLAGSSDSR